MKDLVSRLFHDLLAIFASWRSIPALWLRVAATLVFAAIIAVLNRYARN